MRGRAILAVAIVAAGAAAGAQATYKGGNGRIAFAEREANGVEIVSTAANGSDEQQLTDDPSFNAAPAYAPNGKRIAFCSDRVNGRFEIFTMSADGSGQRQLTHMNGNATFPDYSPSAAMIVFAGYRSGGSKDDLWVMKANGTGLRRLMRNAGNNEQPVWSPDGSRIAFESDRTGVAQIWVMNADGTHQTQLRRITRRTWPSTGARTAPGSCTTTAIPEHRRRSGS